MKNQFFKILFGLWFGFSGNLFAVELKNLYEIEIPVNREGKNFDQAKLVEKGFEKLLIRLSGTKKIVQETSVKTALTNADKYVGKISYHQPTVSQHTIRIVFKENQVKQILTVTHNKAWDKNRPLVLLLVVEEGHKLPRWLGNGDSVPTALLSLEATLKERGVPFVIPLMDLTDSVTEKDVLTEALTPIQETAKRYNPDVILLGKLNQKSGRWQAHWTLLNGENKSNWNNTASELNGLFSEACELLVATLKGIPTKAVTGREEDEPAHDLNIVHPLTISVAGILNGEHYNRVREYLQKLPSVVSVEVTQIMSDKALFEIRTTANRTDVEKSIESGSVLAPTISLKEGDLSYKFSEGL